VQEASLTMKSELVKIRTANLVFTTQNTQSIFITNVRARKPLLFTLRLSSQRETTGDVTKSWYLKQYIMCDCPVNSSLLMWYVLCMMMKNLPYLETCTVSNGGDHIHLHTSAIL